eukprot:167574_1
MMDVLVLSEHSSNDVNPSDYRMIHRIQSYNPEYIGSRKHSICGAIPICCVLNACKVIIGCKSTGTGSNERETNVWKDTKDHRQDKKRRNMTCSGYEKDSNVYYTWTLVDLIIWNDVVMNSGYL